VCAGEQKDRQMERERGKRGAMCNYRSVQIQIDSENDLAIALSSCSTLSSSPSLCTYRILHYIAAAEAPSPQTPPLPLTVFTIVRKQHR